MSRIRNHHFSVHELLVMAALAALGGVTSSALSNVRAALHAIVPSPIGMQPLAGIHVLWFVLAVGLVRKTGAATATSILAGTVELLSGNPHGPFVLMYSTFAGIGVDTMWLLTGARDGIVGYSLAGGVGAATNVIVLVIAASLPAQSAVVVTIALLAAVAFVSGVILAGVLGWWLLQTLRQAGISPVTREVQSNSGKTVRRPRLVAAAALIVLAGSGVYVVLARTRASAESSRPTLPPTASHVGIHQ